MSVISTLAPSGGSLRKTLWQLEMDTNFITEYPKNCASS